MRVRATPGHGRHYETCSSSDAPMAAYAAARRRSQPLTTAYCMTEIAQQPPLRGCSPIVAADDCIDSLDFCACISWLDHSTGADHRSRAFQLTPSVALSLSLSALQSRPCLSMSAIPAGSPLKRLAFGALHKQLDACCGSMPPHQTHADSRGDPATPPKAPDPAAMLGGQQR